MEQAQWLILHALEYFWHFSMVVKYAFKQFRNITIKSCLKQNLLRIKSNLDDLNSGHSGSLKYPDGVYKVTDMLRSTIYVESVFEMEQAYGELEAIQDISILKIINQMNTQHSCITFIIMYQEAILCEIVLRHSKKSALYYANQLVNNIVQSQDVNRMH